MDCINCEQISIPYYLFTVSLKCTFLNCKKKPVQKVTNASRSNWFFNLKKSILILSLSILVCTPNRVKRLSLHMCTLVFRLLPVHFAWLAAFSLFDSYFCTGWCEFIFEWVKLIFPFYQAKRKMAEKRKRVRNLN